MNSRLFPICDPHYDSQLRHCARLFYERGDIYNVNNITQDIEVLFHVHMNRLNYNILINTIYEMIIEMSAISRASSTGRATCSPPAYLLVRQCPALQLEQVCVGSNIAQNHLSIASVYEVKVTLDHYLHQCRPT